MQLLECLTSFLASVTQESTRLPSVDDMLSMDMPMALNDAPLGPGAADLVASDSTDVIEPRPAAKVSAGYKK